MLCPFGAPECPVGFVEYGIDVIPGEDPVWINATHGEWLHALTDKYDLSWATGWAQDPNLLCPLLGIDPLPRVPMPSAPFDPSLKVGAVSRFVGDERAVAWIDDALGPLASKWASERRAPTLLVVTDPAVGMTTAHLESLLEWAGSLEP